MTDEWTAPERPDTRDGGPMTGGERDVLDYWLGLYRETLLLKIGGLTADQLATHPIAASNLSAIGLVRHLTEVEAYWVREVVSGDGDLPDYYCTAPSPDGDFDDVSAATARADVATYEREIALCTRLLDEWTDLDGPVRGQRKGQPVNLRWILTHLIEEYARHLGHLDLVREAIDGRTGY